MPPRRDITTEELFDDIVEIKANLTTILNKLDTLPFVNKEVYKANQEGVLEKIATATMLSKISIVMLSGIVVTALVAWLSQGAA